MLIELEQYEKITEKICEFIHTKTLETNSSGVVFGLSGGIDKFTNFFRYFFILF